MLIFAIFYNSISEVLLSDPEKQESVKSNFYRAWYGYKKCAFGYDFLRPKSCNGSNWLNASLTLIDSNLGTSKKAEL